MVMLNYQRGIPFVAVPFLGSCLINTALYEERKNCLEFRDSTIALRAEYQRDNNVNINMNLTYEAQGEPALFLNIQDEEGIGIEGAPFTLTKNALGLYETNVERSLFSEKTFQYNITGNLESCKTSDALTVSGEGSIEEALAIEKCHAEPTTNTESSVLDINCIITGASRATYAIEWFLNGITTVQSGDFSGNYEYNAEISSYDISAGTYNASIGIYDDTNYEEETLEIFIEDNLAPVFPENCSFNEESLSNNDGTIELFQTIKEESTLASIIYDAGILGTGSLTEKTEMLYSATLTAAATARLSGQTIDVNVTASDNLQSTETTCLLTIYDALAPEIVAVYPCENPNGTGFVKMYGATTQTSNFFMCGLFGDETDTADNLKARIVIAETKEYIFSSTMETEDEFTIYVTDLISPPDIGLSTDAWPWSYVASVSDSSGNENVYTGLIGSE